MNRERGEIHALSTETQTQNVGQDNNSPPESVHNMVSGILHQWIEKEKKHINLKEMHTQNMGQDKNLQTENVHNTVSGILSQWIEKEEKYMHFKQKHTHTTWDKTTTHHLRMYIIR